MQISSSDLIGAKLSFLHPVIFCCMSVPQERVTYAHLAECLSNSTEDRHHLTSPPEYPLHTILDALIHLSPSLLKPTECH